MNFLKLLKYLVILSFVKILTGLKVVILYLRSFEKDSSLQEPEELEPMQIPKDMEFSKYNFSPRYYPNDDMPLMPKYNSFESRLESFEGMEYYSPEEVDLLAKTGFYYCGIRAVYYETSDPEFKPKNGKLAFCFCCGNSVIIYGTYPRSRPVCHHLHCKFFTLPEEKQYVRDLIKPYRGPQDIDYEYVNRIRAIQFPGRIFDYFDDEIEKIVLVFCRACKFDELEVICHPCRHVICIRCAKRKNICPRCSMVYTGLERYFYK